MKRKRGGAKVICMIWWRMRHVSLCTDAKFVFASLCCSALVLLNAHG